MEGKYECPKCGTTAIDKDFDDNTSDLSYTIGLNGIWYWECFICGHEWIEKNNKED